MTLSTYTGETMAEARGKVKKHMGREAVIVSTRTVKRGGWLGLGGKVVVEITAARRMADLPRALRARSISVGTRKVARAEGAATTMTKAALQSPPQDQAGILSEVGALKSMVQELVRETRCARTPDVPEALLDNYQELIQNEVADELSIEMPICHQVYRILYENASIREAVGALMGRELKAET